MHKGYFRDNFLLPAIERDYVEITNHDNPKHPNQLYRLTVKGIALKSKI